jgi:hypothetical protein
MRQHAIGNDDIEVTAARLGEAGAAIGSVLDGVAALAQPPDEQARRFGIIFDEEHVHGAQA